MEKVNKLKKSKTNVLLSLAIAAGVLITLVVIFSLRAAGSTASVELENAQVAGGATIASISGASGGKALQFAATPTTTTPTTPPPSGNSTYKPLTPGTTWQWQISGTINETILDGSKNAKKMFDIDMENTDAQTIARLKAKGAVVICYLEVGAWEDYRSDAGDFPASVKGNPLAPPYQGERYLDIRSATTKDLILKRFDRAQQKGCDGIEPDIDDAYFEDFNGNYSKISNVTGFPISYSDQVNFNSSLAAAAHQRGMSYGLKNGADEKFVNDLLPHLDWVLNEQCHEFSECDVYKPFIAANKAVFNVEYTGNTANFCPLSNSLNFDTLKKNEALDATPRTACRND